MAGALEVVDELTRERDRGAKDRYVERAYTRYGPQRPTVKMRAYMRYGPQRVNYLIKRVHITDFDYRMEEQTQSDDCLSTCTPQVSAEVVTLDDCKKHCSHT